MFTHPSFFPYPGRNISAPLSDKPSFTSVLLPCPWSCHGNESFLQWSVSPSLLVLFTTSKENKNKKSPFNQPTNHPTTHPPTQPSFLSYCFLSFLHFPLHFLNNKNNCSVWGTVQLLYIHYTIQLNHTIILNSICSYFTDKESRIK